MEISALVLVAPLKLVWTLLEVVIHCKIIMVK
jgi:hypothetical protein